MAVTVVDHPLVRHKLGILRCESTGTSEFRRISNEIASLLVYEAGRHFVTEKKTVQGWAGPVDVDCLQGKKVTIVPILMWTSIQQPWMSASMSTAIYCLASEMPETVFSEQSRAKARTLQTDRAGRAERMQLSPAVRMLRPGGNFCRALSCVRSPDFLHAARDLSVIPAGKPSCP